MAVARMLPPTASTTPAQRPFCSGLPEVSFASSREMIVLAPSCVRKSFSSVFPVAATTLVAITGQAGLDRIHKESHQYVDLIAMFRPITKWNSMVHLPHVIPEMVRKAFKLAEG